MTMISDDLPDLKEPGRRLVLTGSPGSGKSRLARRLFSRMSRTTSFERVWFILAANSMSEHMKYLTATEDGAVCDRFIMTFDRLAEYVLGIDAAKILDGADIGSFVKAILDSDEAEKIYPGGRTLPSFAAVLASSFRRWSELSLTPQEMRRFLRNSSAQSTAGALTNLYELFLETLKKSGLMLRRTAYDEAAAQLRAGSAARPEIVFFDGFYEMTSGQAAVFDALMSHKDIRSVFTLPCRKDSFDRFGFKSIRLTYERLCAAGFRDRLMDEHKRQQNAALTTLGDRLFAPSGDNEPRTDPSAVRIYRADNSAIECEFVARNVRKLLTEGGYSPVQIGVVCRSFDDYAFGLLAAFAKENVPVLFHGGFRSEHSRVGVSLTEALRICSKPADKTAFDPDGRRRLLSLLKELAPPDSTQAIDRFELREDATWSSEPSALLPFFAESPPLVSMLTTIAEIRSTCLSARSPSDITRSVGDLLRMIAFRMAPFFEEGSASPYSETAARAFSPLWRAATSFENLHKENFSASKYIEDLCDDLLKRDLASSPPKSSVVHVVDVFEARSWAWKIVFLVGLRQGGFPHPPTSDIFLNEETVAGLRQSGFLFKSESDRREEEALLFYLAATRADERLIFTYPVLDDDSRVNEPSEYLDEIARASKTSVEIMIEDAGKTLTHPIWPLSPDAGSASRDELIKESALRCGRHFRVGDASNADDPAWSAFFREEIGPSVFGRDEAQIIGDLPFSFDIEESKQAIADGLKTFSASRVAEFNRCPFRHFILKLIDPSEPAEPLTFEDARFVGTILHETLKECVSLGLMRGLNKNALSEMIVRHIRRTAPYLSTEDPILQTRLHRWSNALMTFLGTENARLEKSRFAPMAEGTEKGFTALTVSGRDKTKYLFNGRIDRIDVTGDSTEALVIDYKTGKVQDLTRKKAADELRKDPQLLIYMLAVKKFMNLRPSGAAYFNVLKNFRSGIFVQVSDQDKGEKYLKGSVVPKSDFDALLESLEDALASDCARILSGEITPNYQSETCRWCEFGTLCGKNR